MQVAQAGLATHNSMAGTLPPWTRLPPGPHCVGTSSSAGTSATPLPDHRTEKTGPRPKQNVVGFDPRTHTHRIGVRAPSERIAIVRAALAAQLRAPSPLGCELREKVRPLALGRIGAPTVAAPRAALCCLLRAELRPHFFLFFAPFSRRILRFFSPSSSFIVFRTTKLAVHARPRKSTQRMPETFPPGASLALEQQTTRSSPRDPERQKQCSDLSFL
ncbi:hypothetical protein MRX96_026423 [Rhipicephalus microplus]